MKFNITPGPWVIYGQNIYGTDRNGYICTWSGKMANAKAITAVPEMVEALRQLADDKGSAYWTSEEVRQIASNTLKKAGGE